MIDFFWDVVHADPTWAEIVFALFWIMLGAFLWGFFSAMWKDWKGTR